MHKEPKACGEELEGDREGVHLRNDHEAAWCTIPSLRHLEGLSQGTVLQGSHGGVGPRYPAEVRCPKHH